MTRFVSREHIDGLVGAFLIGLGLFFLACTLVGLSVVLAAIAEAVG